MVLYFISPLPPRSLFVAILMMMGIKFLLINIVCVASATSARLGLDLSKIPNEKLGTCLDKKWVEEMEAKYHIDHTERDPHHHFHLKHPFLQEAIKKPRFYVDDPRTAQAHAFGSCAPKETATFGYGAKYKGSTIERGQVNRTLVLELNDFCTNTLSTMAFAIIASEIYGYPVSFHYSTEAHQVTERMSHVHVGACTPTHVNLEVWRAGLEHFLDVYSNETFQAGSVGYSGRSGLYTTFDFIEDGTNTSKYQPIFFAEFWKDYVHNENLIQALSVSNLFKDAKHFPPKKTFCPDGIEGCRKHCSRTKACSDRMANGNKDCLVVLMMDYRDDQGYITSVFGNLNIPAYFCFVGLEQVQEMALEAKQNKLPIVFYHFEPDPFHLEHPDQFERILLPPPLHKRVLLNKGTVGQSTFGGPTSNPVDVDFPFETLVKYASDIMTDSQPIGNLLTKFAISEEQMDTLLHLFVNSTAIGSEQNPLRHFEAACDWIKHHYDVWKHWMDRLPLCTLDDHVTHHIENCHDNSTHRIVHFTWIQPHPDNHSRPYECDGGIMTLPETLYSSHSCEWIEQHHGVWYEWILGELPECDSFYYEYQVEPVCDSHGQRSIQFKWRLPDPSDPKKSIECTGGDTLPEDFKIACEYMPQDNSTYQAFIVIASLLGAVYLIAMGFVYKNRDKPIIKRSQYELLLVMLAGAILMNGASIAYGGEPSMALCGLRPILISISFTLIFGALFVKSLRVYRVFMQKKAMKKIKVTTLQMVKMLSVLIAIDIVILVVWLTTDYPVPTHTLTTIQQHVHVDILTCKSSNFLFSALMIFWKTLVLFAGLYISFLIRNVSSDFQESIWIFASAIVVLMSGLIILPLAYLVELEAMIFYIFLASMLLFCTATVIALMLVPKLLRSSAVNATGSSNGSSESSLSSVVPSTASSHHVGGVPSPKKRVGSVTESTGVVSSSSGGHGSGGNRASTSDQSEG